VLDRYLLSSHTVLTGLVELLVVLAVGVVVLFGVVFASALDLATSAPETMNVLSNKPMMAMVILPFFVRWCELINIPAQ
jgi:hypothetical protein